VVGILKILVTDDTEKSQRNSSRIWEKERRVEPWNPLFVGSPIACVERSHPSGNLSRNWAERLRIQISAGISDRKGCARFAD
jgi:hypothetical protein